MRIFITTVAGCAERFNRDLPGPPALKCIYYENDSKDTILYRLLSMAKNFDRIVVVGGFLYESLLAYSKEVFTDYHEKIRFIFNSMYKSYGTCYSLLLGLEEARRHEPDEILFAEGDLFFDEKSFRRVEESNSDAISTNNRPIESDKSVVMYINEGKRVNYLFDASHKSLFIDEPFISIHNSGQVWKFNNMDRLFGILPELCQKQIEGTNLEIISRYFHVPLADEIMMVNFDEWINCNTLGDYHAIWGHHKNGG